MWVAVGSLPPPDPHRPTDHERPHRTHPAADRTRADPGWASPRCPAAARRRRRAGRPPHLRQLSAGLGSRRKNDELARLLPLPPVDDHDRHPALTAQSPPAW